MNAVQINPHQLKRFVKHLCIVSKHYYDREQARGSLNAHLEKIRTSKLSKEISALDKKISFLLEKEVRVAELGLSKKARPEVLRKIRILEGQLNLTKTDRDQLAEENEELKKAVASVAEFKDSIGKSARQEQKTDLRIKKIETEVDRKYNDIMVSELKDKIAMLENSYKQIIKDKSIHPARLHNIEQKIKEYKQKLKSF